MPLPGDRASLLAAAAKLQRDIRDTSTMEHEQGARRHANALLQLGAVRQRLGEFKAASQLYEDAAIEFEGLDWPVAQEASAMARVRQASAAMQDGRSREALEVLEHLVERSGGFPKFKTFPEMKALGLNAWLALLEDHKEYERLYQASASALELLEPGTNATDKLVLAKAMMARATAAHELGYSEEAIDAYQRAISDFDQIEPGENSRQIAEAMASVAALLAELGRDDEAAAAYGRLITRFKLLTMVEASDEPWVQRAITDAQAWLAETDPD